jgi:hypothetical protein
MNSSFFVRPQHRFFVPTCLSNDAARSGRQGWPSRQPRPKLAGARPRLDGREHGVMINGKRALF